MDMTAINSGLAALQGLVGISRTLLDVRDLAMLGAVQVDLTQRILAVQSALLELQTKQSALLEEMAELKAAGVQRERAAAERERYALHELSVGSFVYRLREGVQPPEPTHYLCQPCHDKGVKAVLERRGPMYDRGPWRQVCPVCRHAVSEGK